MRELEHLLQDVSSAGIWLELAVLSGCMAVAYLVSARLGRGQSQDTVWFGRRIWDGVLFSALCVAFLFPARLVLADIQTVALLRVALPIFISLALIRLVVRVLSSAFPTSASVQFLERLVSWLVWGLTVLWIAGLMPAVLSELDAVHLNIGKSHVSLRAVLEGLLSSSLVLVLTLWLSATLERRVLREAVKDLSMRKVATNALRAFLLFLGLLFALSAVGVDLTALSVLGGALGVGLGFGLQKLAANYVSGFVILLERSLRIGDTVSVDGFEGVVTDIKTRFTVIRASSGREAIVPNETLITQKIENLTLADTQVLITVPVAVAYGSDVDQVMAILRAAALSQKRVLTDPAPAAYLSSFGPDGLDFVLTVWIADPGAGVLPLRSALNLAILAGLREAGIEIPYPQRVVHMRA
jgi:small-conductance mechanosensitive channel